MGNCAQTSIQGPNSNEMHFQENLMLPSKKVLTQNHDKSDKVKNSWLKTPSIGTIARLRPKWKGVVRCINENQICLENPTVNQRFLKTIWKDVAQSTRIHGWKNIQMRFDDMWKGLAPGGNRAFLNISHLEVNFKVPFEISRQRQIPYSSNIFNTFRTDLESLSIRFCFDHEEKDRHLKGIAREIIRRFAASVKNMELNFQYTHYFNLQKGNKETSKTFGPKFFRHFQSLQTLSLIFDRNTGLTNKIFEDFCLGIFRVLPKQLQVLTIIFDPESNTQEFIGSDNLEKIVSEIVIRFPSLRHLRLQFSNCETLNRAWLTKFESSLRKNSIKSLQFRLNITGKDRDSITFDGTIVQNQPIKLRFLKIDFSLVEAVNENTLTSWLNVNQTSRLENLTLDISNLLELSPKLFEKTGTKITKNAATLQNLKLYLHRYQQISDASLEAFSIYLSKPINLKLLELDLSSCYQVTDRGLNILLNTASKYLVNLEKLTIDLSNCPISDVGLQAFCNLPSGSLKRLQQLKLFFNEHGTITEKGLKELIKSVDQQLIGLKEFKLSFTAGKCLNKDSFQDFFPSNSQNLKNLQLLDLDFSWCSEITFEAVERLIFGIKNHCKNLTNLKLTFIGVPKIIQQAVRVTFAEMREQLPKLEHFSYVTAKY